MIKILHKKQFRLTILAIILLEALSLSGYLLPTINKLALLALAVVFLWVALKDLTLAFWLVIAELLIGSKGYLFFLDVSGSQLSLRMVIWLIFMSVWLVKEIQSYLTTRKLSWPFAHYRYYWLALAACLASGLAWGIINHNQPSNIFLDFNNWLYLLLVMPAYRLLNQENLTKYWPLLTAGLTWLVTKTLLLLFFFSHNLFLASTEVYRWVNATGIAEVTEMQSGFFRIFFQSHIYIILAFLALILWLTDFIKQQRTVKTVLFLLGLSAAVVVISLSRSFWLGLVVGLLAYWPICLLYFKLNWRQHLAVNGSWLLALIFGFIIIFGIIRFPYPQPGTDVSLGQLLADRTDVTNEAAAASRWSLLPELWSGITVNPLVGQGFGATITYQTSDPRIQQTSVDSQYTTYAFEWGWLDIWFKLGLIGLLVYLIFLAKLIWDGFRSGQLLGIFLAWGLLVIVAIHFFTPYLNHPLGLGYLLLAAVILDLLRQQTTLAKN